MFALEALQAKHGDCLLLHWGDATYPKLALIDGGPDTVYSQVLKPRLQDIADERGIPRVKLDLTMVSHIDDDHINGILDLADEIESRDAPAEITTLWHNSLEDLLHEKITAANVAKVTASISAAFPGLEDVWAQKVLASVPQGQRLHGFAKRVGIIDFMNRPFQPLVVARSGQNPAIFEGLSLTVISPWADELERLRKKWIELRDENITAAFSDRSVYNLSSIVVLAEYHDKLMLLTGDARGDEIIRGLEDKGLMQHGQIHLDLLKLPHHGSQNNVTEQFFERVRADAYVVSGDHMKFPNPHEKAMGWLADARGNDNYTIHCTYDLPYMRKIFVDRLRVPGSGQNGVKVELD